MRVDWHSLRSFTRIMSTNCVSCGCPSASGLSPKTFQTWMALVDERAEKTAKRVELLEYEVEHYKSKLAALEAKVAGNGEER